MKTRYKHIYFEKGGWGGWICRNNKHGDILGRIIIYDAWKQYVLEANSNCAFSADCLDDISHFIKQLNGKIG